MRYLFIVLMAALIIMEAVTLTINKGMIDYANLLGLLVAGWLAVKLDKEK